MVVDPNGDNLWQLDPSQFLNVSHYNWISDTEFLFLTATTRDFGWMLRVRTKVNLRNGSSTNRQPATDTCKPVQMTHPVS